MANRPGPLAYREPGSVFAADRGCGFIEDTGTDRIIVTFHDADDAARYGPLFAASERLRIACEEVLNAIDAFPHSRQRSPLGRPNGGIATMLREVLALAGGPVQSRVPIPEDAEAPRRPQE